MRGDRCENSKQFVKAYMCDGNGERTEVMLVLCSSERLCTIATTERWDRYLILSFTSQCVAVCCSVLQCVAVCCSVLQCVAVCCSVLQRVAVCCSVKSTDSLER